MSETLISAAVSVAKQSIVEAPVKHVASAGAITTSAMVETVSPFYALLADGTIVMGFLLTLSLFVHTLLKIRKQIRGG